MFYLLKVGSKPEGGYSPLQDDSEVWSLDRTAFRNLVVRSAEAQFKDTRERGDKGCFRV